MAASAKNLVSKIERAFPNISGVKVVDRDKVFLGDVAEGGTIDDLPACNYNGGFSDPQEKIWVMGVHVKLAEIVEAAGWFVEPYDPGTYHAYKN